MTPHTHTYSTWVKRRESTFLISYFLSVCLSTQIVSSSISPHCNGRSLTSITPTDVGGKWVRRSQGLSRVSRLWNIKQSASLRCFWVQKYRPVIRLINRCFISSRWDLSLTRELILHKANLTLNFSCGSAFVWYVCQCLLLFRQCLPAFFYLSPCLFLSLSFFISERNCVYELNEKTNCPQFHGFPLLFVVTISDDKPTNMY